MLFVLFVSCAFCLLSFVICVMLFL